MRKIVVNMNLTLDGVMQAPGRPDEDTRGGFRYGGWAAPYFDPVMASSAAAGMSQMPELLLGRYTYEDWYSVWPNRTDNPFTGFLNAVQKYVVSTKLEEPLPWQNSMLLKGDATKTVAALKEQPGADLAVFGSGVLVRSLMQHNLIDEFVLSIHPLILGSGQHLFTEECPFEKFELASSKTTTTGVVMATYKPLAEKAS